MVAVAFTHTTGWDAVLFPIGVRLSTWVGLAAFVGAALRFRAGRPLAAAAAWFFGFEAAYQATALATGRGLPAVGMAAPILVVFGAAVVVAASRSGVLPARGVMVAVVVVWMVWIATGFHANAATLVGFNVVGEVLNEAAKTLWACAYLLPLVRTQRRRRRVSFGGRPNPPTALRRARESAGELST